MANMLYDKGREAFLKRGDWLNDTIRVVLIDVTNYTVSLANDDFLSVIPAGARVAVSPALANKTASAGVADADDVTFGSVSGTGEKRWCCTRTPALNLHRCWPTSIRRLAYQ